MAKIYESPDKGKTISQRDVGDYNNKAPYISDNFQIGPDGAYEHVDQNTWEEIASEQFKYVGDEGLFPNHTDKDIWMSGFVAAMEWINNQTGK